MKPSSGDGIGLTFSRRSSAASLHSAFLIIGTVSLSVNSVSLSGLHGWPNYTVLGEVEVSLLRACSSIRSLIGSRSSRCISAAIQCFAGGFRARLKV